MNEYLWGVVLLTLVSAPVMAGSWLILRARFGHLSGSLTVLGYLVLVVSGLTAVHVVPGVLGILSPASVILASCVALALAFWACPYDRDTRRPGLVRPALTPGGIVALLGVACAGVAAVTSAWAATVVPSSAVDSLTFHVPNIAKWIQTGSIWRADNFTPLLSNGNYPQNGDIMFLWSMLPFDSDAFVRPLGLPFAAMAGLAVYALGRVAGADRAPAALTAALFTTIPVFVISAYEGANTDVPMLAMFGAGSVFLLLYLGGRRRSDLVLAGLGLGFALGTKWYGLSSVAGVVVVFVVVWWQTARPSLPSAARALGGLALVIAAAGGVWMVRNIALSGSPLYPSPVKPLGLTIFDAPRDFVRECGGFSLAHYATDTDVLREYVWRAFRAGYGVAGAVLALGWVTAVVVLGRRLLTGRARTVPPAVLVLTLPVPLLAAAYAVTPYSAIGPDGAPFAEANLRWLLPAFLLAAAAGAWGISSLPRGRPVLELGLLVAVVAAVHRIFFEPTRQQLSVAAVLAVGLAVVWLVGRAKPRIRRPLAAAAVGVALVATLAVAYNRQDTFSSQRYQTGDPVLTELARAGGSERHVGLAGVWTNNGVSPVLPAFGPRLRGRVDFVGRTRRGQLQEWPRRGQFLGALRRGDYDLLVVGRGTAGYGCPLPGSETDEDRWATEAGFPLVAQTDRLSLYRVRFR